MPITIYVQPWSAIYLALLDLSSWTWPEIRYTPVHKTGTPQRSLVKGHITQWDTRVTQVSKIASSTVQKDIEPGFQRTVARCFPQRSYNPYLTTNLRRFSETGKIPHQTSTPWEHPYKSSWSVHTRSQLMMHELPSKRFTGASSSKSKDSKLIWPLK